MGKAAIKTPYRAAAITGASSGIGAEYARLLAARGTDLVLVARRRERLEALATNLANRHGIQAEVLPADLTLPDDVERVAAHLQAIENLDLLVNNAGFGTLGSFPSRSASSQVEMVALHCTASVRLAHAVLPGMIRRGSGAIINVSSVAAFAPLAGSTVYSATKGFLNAFSVALQAEVGRYGIRIQALCPGFTVTEFHDTSEYERSSLHARRPRFIWMDARIVVERSLSALDRGPVIYIPSRLYRLAALIGRTGIPTRLSALRVIH